VLLIGNHVEFGESNPCRVDFGCIPYLQIQSANGNRVRRRRPSKINVFTIIEVTGNLSIEFPTANVVGSQLDRSNLRREIHADEA
jgi:hypothetical protein